MDLLGISLLIIAIAFALLVIYLIKTLNNLSSVLNSLDKTMDKLPDQLDEVMKETGVVIHNSNETLLDLNEKMRSLTPLFYILGDAGEASRKLSSSLVDVTMSMKKNTDEGKENAQKKDLGGIYGGVALAYYLFQKRHALKNMKEGKQTS
ncbi:DUF948 domain-containing protein [Salibacterium salarium]|uniref:DUF948 domain-containing protein n=1 Tax=Salibacterium salarium TaxID=284579 RepID=A0A428MXX6_9BACI|nr:DUF948 domain-containing protein [Salibacterium salarium]RSL30977.1 DUF948 domain-containing protein [Salibacterium salarium]